MTTSDDIDWTNTSNWNKDMGMTSQEGAVWEVTEDVLLRVEVAMSSTVIRLVPRGETLRQIGNVYAIEDPHCQGLLRAEVECVEGLQESGWVTVCAWAIGGPRYLKHVQEPLKTLATKPVRASSSLKKNAHITGNDNIPPVADVTRARVELDEEHGYCWHFQPESDIKCGNDNHYWMVIYDGCQVREDIRTTSAIVGMLPVGTIIEQLDRGYWIEARDINKRDVILGRCMRIQVRLDPSYWQTGWTTFDASIYGGPVYLQHLGEYDDACKHFTPRRWRCIIEGGLVVTRALTLEKPVIVGRLSIHALCKQIGPFAFPKPDNVRRMKIQTLEDDATKRCEGYVTLGMLVYKEEPLRECKPYFELVD
eukprot:GEMP01042335.1.p1 GENE.GEMP01042335.1~~GEMP01042335.1.p1  ORF type:complete len:390 (-),score=78.57 GEMP01042335.1:675-1769(-)